MAADVADPSAPAPAPLVGRAVIVAFLLAAAAISLWLQTLAPTIAGGAGFFGGMLHVLLGIVVLLLSLLAARGGWGLRALPPAALPWIAAALCVVIGWLSGSAWPNSGDEYSYGYLADTLLAGRLHNPPVPDLALFRMFRVFALPDQTISQYPPGWPMLLAPFRAIGLSSLANPALTGLLGVALLGALRRLGVAPAQQSATLVLILGTPFVLFNGASMFSQTMTAALAAVIMWQQLADEQRPGGGRKLLIGACFGALLLTRYEAFAILAGLYALDRLWYRRWRALRDALMVLVGWLPFAGFCLYYDWALTGDPLLTPASMTNPDMGLAMAFSDPAAMVGRGLAHLAYWTGALGQFGGLAVLVLLGPALRLRWRQGGLRFYDLALPATILFFLYFPYDGGHQYGPRYWFFVWPLAGVSVAAALVRADGRLRIVDGMFSFDGLVAANLLFGALMLPGLMLTTRMYIDARREVLSGPVPAGPAIVLLPTRDLHVFATQRVEIPADSMDFVRNDIDLRDPVLYGRLDAPDSIHRACRLPGGRTVLVWRGPGDLLRVPCPAN